MKPPGSCRVLAEYRRRTPGKLGISASSDLALQSPPVPHSPWGAKMVRRGSPVRVRQRALGIKPIVVVATGASDRLAECFAEYRPVRMPQSVGSEPTTRRPFATGACRNPRPSAWQAGRGSSMGSAVTRIVERETALCPVRDPLLRFPRVTVDYGGFGHWIGTCAQCSRGGDRPPQGACSRRRDRGSG